MSSRLREISALDLEQVGSVTVSAGVAISPQHASERDELIRLADSALYWAKEYGKNRVRAYRPDVIELAELKRLASGPDRAAYLKVLKEELPMFGGDGRMPAGAAEQEWRVLTEFKPDYKRVKVAETYTNEFIDVAIGGRDVH